MRQEEVRHRVSGYSMRQETLPEDGQASPYLSWLGKVARNVRIEYAIRNSAGGWTSQSIPQLVGETGEKCQDIVCDKKLCLRVDKPVHTSAGLGSGEKCQDRVCDKKLCLRVDKPVHTSAGWGKWREMSG